MKNKKIVCIDSDGCVMDTMNYKHICCFGPVAQEVFGIAENKEFLKIWNNINLFSKTRGVNRFVGLYLAFEKIGKPLNDVKKWAETTKELSNDSLKKEIEKTNSLELKKALQWSITVNEKIEAIKALAKPFENVKDAIIEMKKNVDVAIVSSANNEAIQDEWSKFELIKYVDYVMGQSQGTKKDCIQFLINKGYKPNDIIMVGDSPGDIKAAKDNGVLMYPILVNSESKSWKNFKDVVLNMFLNNKYNDKKYIKEYEMVLGGLDAKNS